MHVVPYDSAGLYTGREPMPEKSSFNFLKGYFLISEADLMDPNFYRTVVLMVEHNSEGAFGLVVNRKSQATLSDIVEGFEETPAGLIPVYLGGPVQQEYLFTLHSGIPGYMASEHAAEPVGGVLFEPVTNSLVSYLETEWPAIPPDEWPKIHVFAGYSGWGPGQLERELKEKSWVTHKASPDIVFYSNPEKGWAEALGKKGGLYKIIGETGFKPSMN